MAFPLVYHMFRSRNRGAQFFFSAADDATSAFITSAVWIAGEVKISKDGGATANTTNLPTHVGNGIMSLILTATEMDAGSVAITLIDAGSGAGTASDVLIDLDTGIHYDPYFLGGYFDIASVGSSTTFTISGASALDDFYNEMTVVPANGTGLNQARQVVDYVGASGTVTINRPWVTNVTATNKVYISRGADIWDQRQNAEPTGAPVALTATFRQISQYLLRRFYNKVTQTATFQTVYKDDAATVLTTMAVSDDGTTQTKGQAV